MNGGYRPCLVSGLKALFHGWINEENYIIAIGRPISKENIPKLHARVEEYRVYPGPIDDIMKISNTYALVEFEDGHIGKVEPTRIKFLDSFDEFSSMCWYEKEI